MIRFNVIGDGNCLYYSLMFRLAIDWLNGDLKQDLKVTEQVAALFLELDKIYPNLEIKAKLTDNITPKAIDDIFQLILALCTRDNKTIDWRAYQRLTGAAARNFTVNKIRHDVSIQSYLKANFKLALGRTVDTYEGATDSKYFVYPDALAGTMAVRTKIADAILKDKHKSKVLRKSELINWFENGIGGGKSGFDLWLDHIIKDKMFAGTAEFNVFAESMGITGQYRTLDDVSGAFHLASDPDESISGLSLRESYTLLLNLTKSAHWEVYLEHDAKGTNFKLAKGEISESYQYNKPMISTTNIHVIGSDSSNFSSRSIDSIEDTGKKKEPLIFSTISDKVIDPFSRDKVKSSTYGKLAAESYFVTLVESASPGVIQLLLKMDIESFNKLAVASEDSHFVSWVKQASPEVINVLLKMNDKPFKSLVNSSKPYGIFGQEIKGIRKPGLKDLPAVGLEQFFIAKGFIKVERQKKMTVATL